MKIKEKIKAGFPCNNGAMYMVITENKGMYTITSKEKYDKAMEAGYIEINKSEE